MKQFEKFYRWATKVKFHMAIYTLAAIFIKSMANLVLGVTSVEILTLAQMFLVSLLFACLEDVLLRGGRVVLWALLANVLYGGSALFFGWFRGVPLWCGSLMIFLLEACLFAMWYALYLEEKKERDKKE